MVQGDGQALAWLDELTADVRRWHNLVLDRSGGAAGEPTARLLASCARPFQTAFGLELFATDVDKAAALFHGIITSHAFVDGTKRTASIVTFWFLGSRGSLPYEPSMLALRLVGEVAVETASGRLTVEEVAMWLRRIFAA